jgi:ribonuclease R
MLPEALSNELCSLKPDVDRLTKCVEFVLSKDGKVVSSKFYAAVIRSKRRFTYKQAFEVIGRPPEGEIEQMLHDAHKMAQRIRAHRFRDGSLDLDFPENKIRLDEQGRVLRIERIENDESHQLIEEYMLLANEAVAGRLMQLNLPAVYRVHESPKEKRLKDFRDDVLSHHVPCGNLMHRPEVQKLLAHLHELPIGAALKIGFLRSLMRARYAVEPLGHYGLAKTKYTHFTSPIRRYADLVVHRALFEKPPTPGEARQIADHITATERNSSDAERDSKDVKLYAFLEAQIKTKRFQPYAALVTDVRNFGFFVDVTDLGLSGVVPFSAMTDDFYVFEPGSGKMHGRRTGRVIQLGDRVEVQVRSVDRYKKQVDFALTKGSAVKSEKPQVRDERRPEKASKRHKRPKRSWKGRG